MLALRFAAVLGLVIWIGGLVALGAVAAPAIFDVLGATGTAGRSLAGTVFGEAFARFHIVTYFCAVVIVASLVVRAILGPRPRRFALRMIVSAMMVAAAAYTGTVLIPRIQQAQRTLGASPATLPAADARRVEFARLHGLSSSLQLVPLLGGLALLFFELKD